MRRLAARLDALRRESGAAPEPQARAGDLAARLERLGGRARRPVRRGPVPVDDAGLARRLDAGVAAPGLLCREGWQPVAVPGGRLPGLDATLQAGALFLDTETSGLAGGTGTVAWMVGTARFEAGGLRLRQWLITGFGGEPALLRAVAEAMAAAPLVVTYNGGSFDLPLLRDRTRLVLATPMTDPARHRDLLHDVRRLFAARWPDCRLASAETRLLGRPRGDDLPGSAAPGVWRDLLAGDAGTALRGVLDHNAGDLVTLARLLPVLAAAYREPASRGAEPSGAAGGWLRSGEPEAARQALESAGCHLDVRGLRRLAALHRRAGRWSEAVACWQRLAARGCTEAVERLAKYHEHVARDPERALALTRQLPQNPAVTHRLQRLERRWGVPRNLSLDLMPPVGE